MARPFSRTQVLQNRAFLRELQRTGNVRLSARLAAMKYGTMQHRRATHPAFAQAWDVAIVFAQARLHEKGLQGPVGTTGSRSRTAAKPPSSNESAALLAGRPGAVSQPAAPAACGPSLRTSGGEPTITRRNDGKLQVRAAQPGKLTRQCEQAFLSALSACANVRLAAAAAGAAVAAFYRRRRRDHAFAREWRLALERAYERLEMALLDAGTVHGHDQDDWRHNEPPAMPPMTANQALQLMYLHQKEARLWAEPPHLKKRRGETTAMWSFRVAAMTEENRRLQREKFEIAEAARRERGEMSLYDAWKSTESLPDLGQVTGWSKADPAKAPHDASRALFGGWRLEDLAREGDGG